MICFLTTKQEEECDGHCADVVHGLIFTDALWRFPSSVGISNTAQPQAVRAVRRLNVNRQLAQNLPGIGISMMFPIVSLLKPHIFKKLQHFGGRAKKAKLEKSDSDVYGPPFIPTPCVTTSNQTRFSYGVACLVQIRLIFNGMNHHNTSEGRNKQGDFEIWLGWS